MSIGNKIKPLTRHIGYVYNETMINEKALKRITTYIKLSQYNKLQKLADQTAVTYSDHIRMAIDKYLKNKV